ncbi:MAG: hypothetical protein ACOCVG_03540, partial [Verrucomicrobiota bacterium]
HNWREISDWRTSYNRLQVINQQQAARKDRYFTGRDPEKELEALLIVAGMTVAPAAPLGGAKLTATGSVVTTNVVRIGGDLSLKGYVNAQTYGGYYLTSGTRALVYHGNMAMTELAVGTGKAYVYSNAVAFGGGSLNAAFETPFSEAFFEGVTESNLPLNWSESWDAGGLFIDSLRALDGN